MLKLGVNIDHIATLRQARQAVNDAPLEAALLCEKVGAWGITAHLREDRRHIHDYDMFHLSGRVKNLNFEMAVTDEMLEIAGKVLPHSCCLVPEKRTELTTEGGLDVIGNLERIRHAVKVLHQKNIVVSLFIDPEKEQIAAAGQTGAEYIEMHTGAYANKSGLEQNKELERLIAGAKLAHEFQLKVNAGHGIDYVNIAGILRIPHLCELNIGYSIVCRSVFVGIERAVAEMVDKMREYRY